MPQQLKTIIKNAALKAAGLRRGTVEAGLRANRNALETSPYPYTADQRLWHDCDAPDYAGDLFDVVALAPSLWAGGAVMDLYVYDAEGELVTNVCAVVAFVVEDGRQRHELLACYDSVTLRGIEWSSWWLEGLECKCSRCAALPPLPAV